MPLDKNLEKSGEEDDYFRCEHEVDKFIKDNEGLITSKYGQKFKDLLHKNLKLMKEINAYIHSKK